MQKETLVKYQKLSKDLETKLNAEIGRLTEEMNTRIETAIKEKLDAMEVALKKGDLIEAGIYKTQAEILIGLYL